MSEYFSELLNTEECILHTKAKSAIRRGRYAKMKVDPVLLERVLISLDQARQELAKLKNRPTPVAADLALCSVCGKNPATEAGDMCKECFPF